MLKLIAIHSAVVKYLDGITKYTTSNNKKQLDNYQIPTAI